MWWVLAPGTSGPHAMRLHSGSSRSALSGVSRLDSTNDSNRGGPWLRLLMQVCPPGTLSAECLHRTLGRVAEGLFQGGVGMGSQAGGA